MATKRKNKTKKEVIAAANENQRVEKKQLNVAVPLTDQEYVQLSKEIARLSEERNQLEDERKSRVAEIKAKIEVSSARINEITTSINSGKEYRVVDMYITYNDPKIGEKTIRWEDGTTYKVERMLPSEDRLPGFQVEPPAEDADPDPEPPAEEEPAKDPEVTAAEPPAEEEAPAPASPYPFGQD